MASAYQAGQESQLTVGLTNFYQTGTTVGGFIGCYPSYLVNVSAGLPSGARVWEAYGSTIRVEDPVRPDG